MTTWHPVNAILFRPVVGMLGIAIAAGLIACGCSRSQSSLSLPPPLLGEFAASSDEEAVVEPEVDWPSLFGPEVNCRARHARINPRWPDEGPPEVWRTKVGKGYSSPVISQGKLLIHQRDGNEEQIRCLSAETGEQQWQASLPTTYRCKYLYTDGPYATPLVQNERVYIASAQAKLQCLQLADGALIWQRDLAADYRVPEGLFGFGAGMLIDGETLFLNAGGIETNAGIIAFDINTGETRWTATDHPAAYTTPRLTRIHGRQHLLILTEIGLTDLEPETGTVRWVYEYHSKLVDTLNAVTPVVQDDLVVLIAGPGPGATALKILPDGSYEVAWKERRLLDSQFNNLIHADGFIYGYTSSRQGGATFRCFEVATGKLQWEHSSILGRGSSLATRDAIILLGERGHLASLALDPQSARPISITSLPVLEKPCYSSPALVKGKLYLRNEQEVICFDLSRNESSGLSPTPSPTP